MTETTRLIKKYANRRLYDAEASAHVTLAGIRELIAAGHDVKIIDDTSGKDISRSVLLQIIAEQEQVDEPILDEGFLKRIIRSYGTPSQSVIGGFLSSSFDTLMEQQALYRKQMRKAMADSPINAIRNMTAENLRTLQKMQDAFINKISTEKDPD